MKQKLARVRWRIGQVLRPDDLACLEGSLTAEAQVRAAAAAGLPTYGVARLTISEKELARGFFVVEELTCVLRSGEVVEVLDNAERPANLDLNKLGLIDASIYLHVLDPRPADEGGELAWPTGAEPERLVAATLLTTSADQPHSRSLLLARVSQAPGGGPWRLSDTHVPPLLRLCSTPHLAPKLRALLAALDSFEELLGKQVAAARRRCEPVHVQQRGRAEVRKARAVLSDAIADDTEKRARLHPYFVYDALRALFIELCLLEGEVPAKPLDPYDHDHLGETFGKRIDAVLSIIRRTPPAQPTVELVLEGEVLVARHLPNELLDAAEVYLLIQRPTPYTEVPMREARLVAPDRLRTADERSTRGVPLRLRDPAFAGDFGAGFTFYELLKRDAAGADILEWAHVRTERAIALKARPDLKGSRAALYWRYHDSSQS